MKYKHLKNIFHLYRMGYTDRRQLVFAIVLWQLHEHGQVAE